MKELKISKRYEYDISLYLSTPCLTIIPYQTHPHLYCKPTSMGRLHVLVTLGVASTLLISSHAKQHPSRGLAQASSTSSPIGGEDGAGVDSIITESLFDQILKHRNDDLCPAKTFYTYDAFISAANAGFF